MSLKFLKSLTLSVTITRLLAIAVQAISKSKLSSAGVPNNLNRIFSLAAMSIAPSIGRILIAYKNLFN